MKVYFDIITNHTADVIGYEATGRAPRTCRRTLRRRRATAGWCLPHRVRHPFDDRDYAGTNRFPPLDPAGVVPVHPGARAGRGRTSRSRPGSTTSRCTTTAATPPSPARTPDYGDFFGLDDLFTEHPRVVRTA